METIIPVWCFSLTDLGLSRSLQAIYYSWRVSWPQFKGRRAVKPLRVCLPFPANLGIPSPPPPSKCIVNLKTNQDKITWRTPGIPWCLPTPKHDFGTPWESECLGASKCQCHEILLTKWVHWDTKWLSTNYRKWHCRFVRFCGWRKLCPHIDHQRPSNMVF